jgi:TRAP-type C4-dicarboxylate transport system permease small subunit
MGDLFWKIFDKSLNVMAGLAGVILVFMTAAVCYTIFMRFFFTRTTIWVMQATEYGLLWVVFLSTAWLLKEQGHVVTEILHSAFRPRTRRYLDVTMFILGGLACAVCAYYAIEYTYGCTVKGITDVRGVTVPKAMIFCIVPVGFILLTMQFFRMTWETFARKDGP